MTKERSLKRNARATARDFRALARERAQEAIDSLVEAAAARTTQAQRAVQQQLRDRPVAVTATALGVGVLMGLALRGGGNHVGRH
jgi:hypothetical protein